MSEPGALPETAAAVGIDLSLTHFAVMPDGLARIVGSR